MKKKIFVFLVFLIVFTPFVYADNSFSIGVLVTNEETENNSKGPGEDFSLDVNENRIIILEEIVNYDSIILELNNISVKKMVPFAHVTMEVVKDNKKIGELNTKLTKNKKEYFFGHYIELTGFKMNKRKYDEAVFVIHDDIGPGSVLVEIIRRLIEPFIFG